MGLDMSIIRRKRGERGRSKTSKYEKIIYREYYKDDEIINMEYAKEGKIKYNQAMSKKSDFYLDVLEIAYWRKANAIHKYLVDNLQGGVDNCKDYRLTKEVALNLYNITSRLADEIVLKDGYIKNGYKLKTNIFGKSVKKYNKEKGKIVKNVKLCEKLLPTQDGFFFGNTQYNEHYYNDIVYTRDIMKTILLNYDLDNDELYYSSSW